MGKDQPTFERNKVTPVKVEIVNASKLKLSEKKQTTVFYERYSGYPGGLTKERMDARAARKGFKVLLEDAVYGMIPGNKLRPRIMKNLTVTE
jgi:large subunit ribosomal protein L13